MGRTSGRLLTAARTYSRENRLTELLAVVLSGSPALVRRLLDETGLPSRNHAECEISTQHRTRKGKYVDLQILALDKQGHPVALVWSEHKTGSAYSPRQLPGYAYELAQLPTAGRLITVVDSSDRSTVPVGDWQIFTWQDLGLWAADLGSERLGPNLA